MSEHEKIVYALNLIQSPFYVLKTFKEEPENIVYADQLNKIYEDFETACIILGYDEFTTLSGEILKVIREYKTDTFTDKTIVVDVLDDLTKIITDFIETKCDGATVSLENYSEKLRVQ